MGEGDRESEESALDDDRRRRPNTDKKNDKKKYIGPENIREKCPRQGNNEHWSNKNQSQHTLRWKKKK